MNGSARSTDAVCTAVRQWGQRLGWGDHPDRMLVGVSGGVDSIVLLHAMVCEGFRPRVVHVHHGLRAESDAEEAFVRSVCGQQGLEIHVVRAPAAPSTGRQAWARHVRHTAFLDAARSHDLEWVLVGHHADDQLETQLLHLDRGTGLAGLAGMPATRPLERTTDSPLLVRPLLEVCRAEIRDAARVWDLAWVEDGSNRDLRYRRNAIRAELAAFESADLLAFREAGVRVAARVSRLRQAVRERLAEGEGLSDADLESWPPPVRELIVLEWLALHAPDQPRRRSVVRRILSLQEGQPGRKVRLGAVVVWRERTGFTVRPHTASESPVPVLSVQSLRLPDGTIQEKLAFLALSRAARGSFHHAFVDADVLAGPPALRDWRAGDRFQPLGMQGSRKIKSYLTDRKVPSSEKAGVQVCCAGSEIVWVVGHQSDHRFRITEHTRTALILSVSESPPAVEDNPG